MKSFLIAVLHSVSLGLVLFAAAFAFGADVLPVAAPPVTSAPPSVLIQLLQIALPFIITALVALHPLIKLAGLFHAMKDDAAGSALKHTVGAAGEVLSTSLDHYLEESGQDFKDLLVEEKRAAAVAAIKKRALDEAPAAVLKAVGQLGETWLAGASSQVVDAAVAKAKLADPPKP